MNNDFIYDIECYPNVFTLCIKSHNTDQFWLFEISFRRNDWLMLNAFIHSIRAGRMVGYNSVLYDYPLLHFILSKGPQITNQEIYDFSTRLITAPDDEKWSHVIWDNERIVEQIDLFLIHHFNNKAKMTSLKLIEFNMRLDEIQDLPYEPGIYLDNDQVEKLIAYNHKDVNATHQFFIESLDHIKFREYLSAKYGRNMMNFNDTKIGKEHVIREIENIAPGTCYYKDQNGNRQPRQTWRPVLNLFEIVFPYVKFEQPGFNAVLQWLNVQSIRRTKGVFTDIPIEKLGSLQHYCHTKETKQKGKHAPKLNVVVNNFQYDFGTGGLHGSVESQKVSTDQNGQIIDIDVASFYPMLAIKNRLFPDHLGELFCDIYNGVRNERFSYEKGTPENKALKLALNGTYGDTNNPFSPFYDPMYTMAITINGQLLLCMLAEQLIKIPGLQMIQANTDGITVKCPYAYIDHFRDICKWWENYTHLELEENFYSHMWIRDVNNYIAQYDNGKVKRKGVFEYELEWHKNHSALIIKRAAEAHLLYGVDIPQFIIRWHDKFDFFLRAKVPRSSRLVMVDAAGNERELQHITRYYVSNNGGELVKIMPPLAKAPDVYRRIGISVGHKTVECNNLNNHSNYDFNYQYYIDEAKELTKHFN